MTETFHVDQSAGHAKPWPADPVDIYRERSARLQQLRENPRYLAACRVYYRDNHADFLDDWALTYDPRSVDGPKIVPFALWDKQREFLAWIHARRQARERGVVEKSRDCGATWLAIGYAVCDWLFTPESAIGFGSRKEDLVDKSGDMDSIFEKIRWMIQRLPRDFMPWLDPQKHLLYMRCINPHNGSSITGEAGDNIGRGGRKSLFFVDEAAYVEHQLTVDNALSETTDCQIDISTFNGSGNLFYKKIQQFQGSRQHFILDWRDDPRKDDAWYAKQKADKDTVTVAQELDRDPHASSEDIFIPAAWVNASIDLHKRLGVEPSGIRGTGFDVADVGDARATCSRYGWVITQADTKREGDITDAIPWAYAVADEQRSDYLSYDADGMGAPSMKLSLERRTAGRCQVVPYYGSAGVRDPDKHDQGDKTLKKNKDRYQNFRAQSWTDVRNRFERAHKVREALDQGHALVGVDPDELISIDSDCNEWQLLVAELSRPKREYTESGKIRVESKAKMAARGVDSPNLADGLIIVMSVRMVDQSTQHRQPPRTRRRTVRDRGVGI